MAKVLLPIWRNVQRFLLLIQGMYQYHRLNHYDATPMPIQIIFKHLMIWTTWITKSCIYNHQKIAVSNIFLYNTLQENGWTLLDKNIWNLKHRWYIICAFEKGGVMGLKIPMQTIKNHGMWISYYILVICYLWIWIILMTRKVRNLEIMFMIT